MLARHDERLATALFLVSKTSSGRPSSSGTFASDRA
jgi:hypothetical protein